MKPHSLSSRPIPNFHDPRHRWRGPSCSSPRLPRRTGGLQISAVLLAVCLLALPAALFAAGEQRFNSPQDAVKALVAAAETQDTNALRAVFGPAGHELVSSDVVQASEEREFFMKRLATRTDFVVRSEAKVELEIGADGWPFPIPLVKQDNQWFFDTAAGAEEILNRRIGRNEMGAIAVCHAYVLAQREYALLEHDEHGVSEYAQLLRSADGTRNGLYWPAKEGEALSPLGPLVAQARIQGYRARTKTRALADDQSSPYHGYFFKILTRQGRNAPGGKYNYTINGHMVAGFALVAWPEEWGNTGVMTFLVNQSGKIYEKSLGPKTAAVAGAITSFDPDPSWAVTREE
jgi:hypothetical protein